MSYPHRMLRYEKTANKQGYTFLIGLDEVGRGPLAGPVVASAVSLKSYQFFHKICDSKMLSSNQREKAFHEIWEKAYVGIGIMSEQVIDASNILKATFFAMNNAIRHLLGSLPKEISQNEDFHKKIYLLIDGNRFTTDLPFFFRTITGGDRVSLSIAAASIVAKVMRDRILKTYDKIFPQYGFQQNKGYPTRKHRQAIRQFGLCPIHRKTFKCSL